MDSFLDENDWESLASHAMTPYLPFLGGVGTKSILNYAAPKSGRVVFYIVRFEPRCFSSIGLTPLKTAADLALFREQDPTNDSNSMPLNRVEVAFRAIKDDKQNSENLACEEWANAGFGIFGSRGVDKLTDWDGQTLYTKPKPQEYLDWESLPLQINLGAIPFLKTGLSASDAKGRGKKLYTQVLYEHAINNPTEKWQKLDSNRASTIETLVHLKILFSHWKDICWFYSPSRINYTLEENDFQHCKVSSSDAGLTESWLWEKHQTKCDLAISTFELLNGLPMDKLATYRHEVEAFYYAWRWTIAIKRKAFVFVKQLSRRRDLSIFNSYDSFTDFMLWANQPPPSRVNDFLMARGFYSKWLPRHRSGLDFLSELDAKDFIADGSSNWTDYHEMPSK